MFALHTPRYVFFLIGSILISVSAKYNGYVEYDNHEYNDKYGKHDRNEHYQNEHYGYESKCRVGSIHCKCEPYGQKCDKNLFCNYHSNRCEDKLYAKMAAYPGTAEDTRFISGEVTVSAIVADKKYDHHSYDRYGSKLCDKNATTLVITWNFKGHPGYTDGEVNLANVKGVHIHTGNTCKSGDLVGGHFWCGYSGAKSDPWNGVEWSSNKGTANVQVGLSLAEVVGRTFVIHRDDGQRWACGVLMPEHKLHTGVYAYTP